MKLDEIGHALEQQHSEQKSAATSFSTTMLKIVENNFSYFSNIFPDFKSGSQILLIHFPTFLT